MRLCHLASFKPASRYTAGMMKFSEWLDANPTMSTTLMNELGVKRAIVSHVRTGARPMPREWLPTVVRLSKRKLSYESLVHEMLEVKRAKGTLRRSS